MDPNLEKIAAEHWERQTKLDAQYAMASKLDNAATVLMIISIVFIIAMFAMRLFKSEGVVAKSEQWIHPEKAHRLRSVL